MLLIYASVIVVVASVAIIVSVVRVFLFVQGERFMPSCLRFSLGRFCDMSCILFSGTRAPFPSALGREKKLISKGKGRLTLRDRLVGLEFNPTQPKNESNTHRERHKT